MGKSQKKRSMRRHNPMRVPDSHLPKGLAAASSSSNKTEAVLPIIKKVCALLGTHPLIWSESSPFASSLPGRGFFSDGERRPRRAQVGLCRRLKFDTQRPVHPPPLAGKERRGDVNRSPHGFRGRGRRRSCRGASVRFFSVSLFQVSFF